MRDFLAAAVIGLLFGLGLTVAAMIDPAKILSFLDVAALPDGIGNGGWDPSLALVMAAALGVTAAGYRLVLARRSPLLAPRFNLPTAQIIDRRLIGGSALFGIGWGLAGLCPGPAVAVAGIGGTDALLFLASMIAGMAIAWLWTRRAPRRTEENCV